MLSLSPIKPFTQVALTQAFPKPLGQARVRVAADLASHFTRNPYAAMTGGQLGRFSSLRGAPTAALTAARFNTFQAPFARVLRDGVDIQATPGLSLIQDSLDAITVPRSGWQQRTALLSAAQCVAAGIMMENELVPDADFLQTLTAASKALEVAVTKGLQVMIGWQPRLAADGTHQDRVLLDSGTRFFTCFSHGRLSETFQTDGYRILLGLQPLAAI